MVLIDREVDHRSLGGCCQWQAKGGFVKNVFLSMPTLISMEHCGTITDVYTVVDPRMQVLLVIIFVLKLMFQCLCIPDNVLFCDGEHYPAPDGIFVKLAINL